MNDIFSLADGLGPEKVVHLCNRAEDLNAIVVIDNTAMGPSVGGVRMAPDVSLQECMRLARAMTLKNAAAGLPHGGGKAVIQADPTQDPARKQRLVRAFAQAIRSLDDYVPGPDMGTDETCMAWVREEIGRSVGLPRVIGGIPLDEIGATGFGVAVAAEVAQAFGGVPLQGARVAIQGFGAVGRHAARHLLERGARIVAVCDSRGAVFAAEGLDVPALLALKAGGRPVTDLDGVQSGPRDAVIAADCDILIPAARPDILDAANIDAVRATLIVQGANIPATAEAEERLRQRGVLQIPDFIANAGGVICAAVEYAGGTESQAMATIEERIRRNTREVLQRAREHDESPREAATALAENRLREAMALRRFGQSGVS